MSSVRCQDAYHLSPHQGRKEHVEKSMTQTPLNGRNLLPAGLYLSTTKIHQNHFSIRCGHPPLRQTNICQQGNLPTQLPTVLDILPNRYATHLRESDLPTINCLSIHQNK